MNSSARRDMALLLVEENEAIRESLRNWISMTFPDIRLLEAPDHSAGMFLSRSEAPDVVVMDISGLGKGGVETVRGMKTSHPSAPILALVTLEHKSYLQAVLEAGAETCACLWNVRSEVLPQLEERLRPA